MKIKVKKWDMIIICLLFVISFLPYLFIKIFLGQHTDYVSAYINIEGEFYKEIPLTGQIDYKEYIIRTKEGVNIIAVQNESIAVVRADCSDHVCEAFGYKSKPGETIVCLPHKLYIELKGEIDKQVDEDIDVIAQ